MNELYTQHEERRRMERNNRLREVNELLDEFAHDNYTHVVTVGQLHDLLQERNAILLQIEAERNRKLSTPAEREAAAYECTHTAHF